MEIWDNTNGLPQSAVFALEKDNQGYLWIATEEGLVRFDGTFPKVFDQENYPEMLEQTYYTFFKTPGGIWATADRSIALLEKNILKVIDCSVITEGTWIRAVAENGPDEILIGTQKGEIHVLKNNQFSKLDFWTPELKLEILSFYPIQDSKLLVGTNYGLYEVDFKNKKTTLISSLDFAAQKVFGTGESLFVSSRDSGIFRLKSDYAMESIISHEDSKDANPSSFTTDSENRIWAGSLEKGLLMIEGNKVIRFTYPELKNFTVRKIIKEKNNLYLGTLGKGLVVIKPAKVNQLNFEELQGKNIKALIQSKDSSIWVGTRSEGIHRIKSGKITSITTNEGLLQNGITTVGSSDNKIYAGSTSGITIIDSNTAKVIGKITKEDGLKSNYVYAVYRDSRDWIWILTRYGGIHYLDENRKLNTVELPEEFANTNFISVLELKNKQLVIGSMNKGIFKIKDGIFLENRPLPLTPGEDLVYCIYEDKSGDLWMGTHGGIVLLIGESFKVFKKSNGLKSQSVYSITDDGIGGVWISNNFGVQYFSLSELESFKASTENEFFGAFTLYNQSTGMPNSEANGLIFPASLLDFSGKLWIPTVEGLGILDPQALAIKTVESANFTWDELQIGDKKTPIKESIIIPEGVSMFQISYSLIDFENSAQYSLFYKIDKNSEVWLPIKDQRQLIFYGLKPGEYVLEIKVIRQGVLDSIQSLPIQVTARVFETNTFKILGILALCILVYFFVKFYLNTKMKNDLETKVKKRTMELQEINEKLKDAMREIEDQNIILKDITWSQSHLVRAPLTKAMGINQLLLNYPKYSSVGKSKEELEVELLETLKQLDEIVKETHSKSENLKK